MKLISQYFTSHSPDTRLSPQRPNLSSDTLSASDHRVRLLFIDAQSDNLNPLSSRSTKTNVSLGPASPARIALPSLLVAVTFIPRSKFSICTWLRMDRGQQVQPRHYISEANPCLTCFIYSSRFCFKNSDLV